MTIQIIDIGSGPSAGDGNSYTFNNSLALLGVPVDKIGTDYLNGYIDELRVTLGAARYTNPYPVPTGPFPRA